MTQEELKLINAINYEGLTNEMWGFTRECFIDDVYGADEQIAVKPHIYVFRKDTEEPTLQDVKPDMTFSTSYQQVVDIYFIKIEGGAK